MLKKIFKIVWLLVAIMFGLLFLSAPIITLLNFIFG